MFVHASHSEGMPIAVLEALAASKPCVLTTGTMMNAYEGNGIVVADTESAFAAALDGLLSSPSEHSLMAARASLLARTELSWSELSAQVLDVYRSALETRSHRTK